MEEEMFDERSGADAPQMDSKLTIRFAMAGLAATFAMPAGAAIVSNPNLEAVVDPTWGYELPGIPQIDFFNGIECLEYSGKACLASRSRVTIQGEATFDSSTQSKSVAGRSGLDVSAGSVIGPGGYMPPYLTEVIRPGTEDAYLAIMFVVDQDEHYGWVHFSLPEGPANVPHSLSSLVIHGYGYNDTAGASIRAGQTTDIPEPGTLALLAAGVVGMGAGAARRRAARQAT
jgi:hypothetical protein